MPKTAIKIGPQDHGRRMSLADFDHAEVQEGHLYELSRGVITVSDVPKLRHLAQINAIRRQVHVYDATNPGRIHAIASGNECKLLLAGWESERHPDLAIYRMPPPETENVWAEWVPDILMEVLSRSSAHRDLVEKREEYFDFGVKEYWIFDADEPEMLVLIRSRGKWTERHIRPPRIYRTRLLPGFDFDCSLVFAAADAANNR
jgi:hypothetical protein